MHSKNEHLINHKSKLSLSRMKKHCLSGFTLIELMIVVAVIGILAAVAIVNFMTFVNKSRVATATSTCESIRAGTASYASDSVGNYFPGSS